MFLSHSTSIAPQSGSDVVLTIGANIKKRQKHPLSVLSSIVRSQDFKGRSASVVALDCTNGEVIAMASYQRIHLQCFVGEPFWILTKGYASSEANYPLMNRNYWTEYPSGSYHKNALTRRTQIRHCDGNSAGIARVSGLVLASSTACCWLLLNTVNLITGITNSCDIVFMRLVRASS